MKITNLISDVLNNTKVPLKENVLDFPRKRLAQDVWMKDGTFRPSVKKEVMATFEAWQKKMFPEIKIENIFVLGSITTFQYNKTSDIDINIITGNTKEEIKKIWKTLPNGNKIGEHPVNYYLSVDTKDVDMSKTLYDLQNNKWVREPSEKQNIMPEKYSLEIAKFFMDGIDLRYSEYNRDVEELDRLQDLLKDKASYFEENELEEEIAKKEQEIKADIEALRLAMYIIKSFRNEGFDEREDKFNFTIKVEPTGDPNHSLNNLIYKELERFGYLDKIKKIVKD